MNEKSGYVDIELSLIDKNEDNDKIFNMNDIEYLAKSIEEEGFYGAIEVFKKPNGRYEISSGHRRFEAMKYLHRESIPCIVNDMPDDYKVGIKLLSCNLKTRKLTPLDMARSIAYYEQLEKKNGKKGNFSKKAAAFFNISEPQVYRFQVLLKLIPELQELADDPGFPYSALRSAVNLTPEAQLLLYNQINSFILENNVEDEDDTKEYKLSRGRIETLIENLRRFSVENQARPNLKRNKALLKDSSKHEDIPVVPKSVLQIRPLELKRIENTSTVEEEAPENTNPDFDFEILIDIISKADKKVIASLGDKQRQILKSAIDRLSKLL